MASSRQDKTPI